MNPLLQPPFTDNEPTPGLGENPKSLTSLAELVLKQGSEELSDSGESTGKQESSEQSSTCKHDYQKGLLEGGQSSSIHSLTMGSLLPLKGQDILKHETISQPDVPKQSSTCKHDYQKGLLEGQSSSVHSLTMGSLLPFKGQDLLKLETISQPDVPKMSSLKDILMLRRALHIRYLSLAITTHKYTGRLTSDVSIEYDSTNNKFTVVSSDKNSWLLEPLQRDLKNLSEQPELKESETDFVQVVIERSDYYVIHEDYELGSIQKVVLLNYMSIMKIRKWEQQTQFPSFDRCEHLYFDISVEKRIHRICKAVVEKHVGSVKKTRHECKYFHSEFCYLIHLIGGILQDYKSDISFELRLIKQELFDHIMTSGDNLEELKVSQLMLLLVDQITITWFISEHTVHWNTYLDFLELLHS